MFTFSKVVGTSLGALALGSTGIVVAPAVLKDLPLDLFTKQKERLKGSLDLEILKGVEQQLKSELDNLKGKLDLALRVTSALGNKRLSQMHEKFKKVEESEGNLKEKYLELTKKVEELSKLLSEESSETEKKLKAQSVQALADTYSQYYDALSRHFHKWDRTILEIVCAINSTQTKPTKKKEEEDEQECEIPSLVSRVYGKPETQAGSGGGHQQASGSSQTGEASQEALKKLNEVKAALESMSNNIERGWKQILFDKSKSEHIKIAFETYGAYLDYLIQLIKTSKEKKKLEIGETTNQAKEIVNQINKLNGEIVQVNKEWGKLKDQYTVIKTFEGKVKNELCNLNTIKAEDCFPSSEPN
ncbi:hypothetical protein MHLP_03240 [Candidatus Mycoplasma haematolamae str. Purdue]|uniref:Uncharacterized protein n=1 Tax=Mycoplasma haematolamae (strain Purdue) TaxID=1212765 RepID=I7BK29_MYCHA|nr:hypothetical protein [Candidatus Mycoplasma haematolamae]AFO52228.1 hypothetical protein MHLP_03240 [Candidatus Mycoplasma haematolamae str. Purdue]